MEDKIYDYKQEDPKLRAAGWVDRHIGLWLKEGSCFLLDTNAEVGVIYHKSYVGFDGFLEFFYTGEEALEWIEKNELEYQERYGK